MNLPPVRILIVKIAAIGDAVMAMPLLCAVRKKYPEARISWLCGQQIAPLIRATNLVDEIIEVDEKKLLTGSFWTKVWHLGKVWRRLGLRQFDHLFLLHRDWRYRLLTMGVFCAHRIGWKKGKKNGYPRPGRYHAEENVRMLEGWDAESVDVRFPNIHAELRPGLSFFAARKPLAAIAPGGAKNVLTDDFLRRWPIESYVALIQRLMNQRVSVAIIGGEGDRWVEPFLPEGIYNCIGRMDLLDLTAALKNCSLLVTHDSGPLHLAKLVNCPAIALFGPTNPLERISNRENIRLFWGGKKLLCRPCYNGKTYRPCKNNRCLSEITPEDVFLAAMQTIQGNQ